MLNRSLIIGYGEVGQALASIFQESADVIDNGLSQHGRGRSLRKTIPDFNPDILHICFPHSENFIDEVKKYQEQYKPKYTIIHSTVPVGTSAKVGAIHSPIRGIHPYLEKGIRTFPKFIGGKQASEVADYFRRAGLKVILYDSSEATEALKIFDTEQYREAIRICQRIKKYCDEHGLNFHEVYTIPNETYNDGYTKLGHPEFVRPVLQPIMTEIGGHCLVPNSKMIEY